MSKVSGIIATYNRAAFIAQAVDSVLGQTYQNVELIVVDDGSTDNTREVLAGYGGRLRYIYQDQRGRSLARNTGIRSASGDYIAFLDSDDIWLPQKLEKQLSVLESNPSLGLVHCLTEVIDEQGRRLEKETTKWRALYEMALRRGYTYEAMSLECVMYLSSVMVRRECFDSVGLFDASIPAFEDWDWYLRFALQYEVAIVTEPLVLFRVHRANTPMHEFTEGRIKTCLKHLALLDTHERLPFGDKARRNFYLNLATAHYMAGNMCECRDWTLKAARGNLRVLLKPDVLVHFFLSWLPLGVTQRLRNLKSMKVTFNNYVGR